MIQIEISMKWWIGLSVLRTLKFMIQCQRIHGVKLRWYYKPRPMRGAIVSNAGFPNRARRAEQFFFPQPDRGGRNSPFFHLKFKIVDFLLMNQIFIWFTKFRIRTSWYQVAPAPKTSSAHSQTHFRSNPTTAHTNSNQHRFRSHTHARHRSNPSQHTLLASLDPHIHVSRLAPRSLAMITVTASLATGHVTTFADAKTSVQHRQSSLDSKQTNTHIHVARW